MIMDINIQSQRFYFPQIYCDPGAQVTEMKIRYVSEVWGGILMERVKPGDGRRDGGLIYSFC